MLEMVPSIPRMNATVPCVIKQNDPSSNNTRFCLPEKIKTGSLQAEESLAACITE